MTSHPALLSGCSTEEFSSCAAVRLGGQDTVAVGGLSAAV